MDKKKFIMLHDISYLENGKFEVIRFVLKISKIIDIKEDIKSSFSMEDVVEEDKSKLVEYQLGKHFCEITMDYLDTNGNQKVFRAIEDVPYIYSQINKS